MQLVLDSETDVVWKGKRKYLDPWTKGTGLVAVGAGIIRDGQLREIKTWVYKHDEKDVADKPDELQALIDEADELIFHNAQFDVPWLRECSFKMDRLGLNQSLFDTMLVSYVFSRSKKESHSLFNSGIRYEVTVKKAELMEEYYKKKIPMSQVPLDIMLEYLEGDIQTTAELYLKFRDMMEEEENIGLKPTIELTNEVCIALCDLNRNGVRVDLTALKDIQDEFLSEKEELTKLLTVRTQELMGDTPINWGSPEQLSTVIYSREPLDKKDWKSNFSYWMNDISFKRSIKDYSRIVYKTLANKCQECNGTGELYKTRINGERYKNPHTCTVCEGKKFIYKKRNEVAGLKFIPPDSKWVADAGFSTSKDSLYALSKICEKKGMQYEKEYLDALIRVSALDSYLANFVEGIARNVSDDGLLHINLFQWTTATARLSGREPNMQNMPRGNTFPVRKVFRSRWRDGKIMEGDAAQLEFRMAVFQSQDEVGMREIKEGFDVHGYTAKCMTDAGEPTSRQEAKAHTFKPLYGGTSGTPAQQAYYKAFTDKYEGIVAWQNELCEIAVKSPHIITLPSGREYKFETAKRTGSGKVTPRTKIVNYPVQGFATADVVPAILVNLFRAMKEEGVKSLIVNTVHDSVVVDVYPGEEKIMAKLMYDTFNGIVDNMKVRWDIDFNVPLDVEIKMGDNWLNTHVVKIDT